MSKGAFPSEHVEAVNFMRMCFYGRGKRPDLAEIFAVPNGGDRHPAVAAKLKAEGVRKGVSDYLLLVPRGTFHGMALELKRVEGSGLEPEQVEFLERCRARGYHATWARGAEAAFQAVCEYLDLGLDSRK